MEMEKTFIIKTLFLDVQLANRVQNLITFAFGFKQVAQNYDLLWRLI